MWCSPPALARSRPWRSPPSPYSMRRRECCQRRAPLHSQKIADSFWSSWSSQGSHVSRGPFYTARLGSASDCPNEAGTEAREISRIRHNQPAPQEVHRRWLNLDGAGLQLRLGSAIVGRSDKYLAPVGEHHFPRR